MEKKVTIIGGGPAGMSAAIFAAKIVGGDQVVILEKNKIMGRKLLATGNGRCNMTNENCDNSLEVLTFFKDMGIFSRTMEEGRVYPYTEQAATVQEALEREMLRLGITLLKETSANPKEIKRLGEEFVVKSENNATIIKTKNLVLASGGKAGPQYGSTGDGYTVAANFGHSIVKPIPSLVQITSSKNFFKDLKGVRVKGEASIEKAVKKGFKNSEFQVLDRAKGEIQFTEYGVSGICIFDLSRNIRLINEKDDYSDYRIVLDIMPEFTLEQIRDFLEKRLKIFKNENLEGALSGMVNKKLIPIITKESKGEAKFAAQLLKRWEIPISGTKGFKDAQVTSGGVSLDEINSKTMESKLVPRLFFAGEITDYDGKCGGYNLQWAFESGMHAGKGVYV